MLLIILLSCAVGADTPGIEAVGTVGDSAFWHEHPIGDVHVGVDGTLRTFAGCVITTWGADGAKRGETTLKGCTAGLNDGLFSPDGEWVAASGLWTGEQGVWRSAGGKVVHKVESVTWSRFCAGGLWDVDGSKGFRRLDLSTGEVTHPSGDHGTGFLCVDDAWMLDEHGHRIDPDGTVVELPDPGDSRKVVGQTGDGRAIVYLYEQSLVRMDRDGQPSPGVAVPDVPETVVAMGEDFLVQEDGVDDIVWHIGADGSLKARHYSEGQGLGARAGLGSVFLWGGRPWGWAGHRVFPLEGPVGPDDSTGEVFFFDADELYVCHGSRCEARRVDALQGPVRIVELMDRVSDETKVSPYGRFLAQYDTENLYRITLDTGEVAAQPTEEWVDGLSVDASGHFLWRLSSDDNDDGVYTTRVFERRDGQDIELGSWRESWLSDPGWSLLQLGPTMRWPGGRKAGYEDADNWFESPDGRAFLLSGYGSRLEVFDGKGQVVAQSSRSVDTMGAWGNGAWVASGSVVRFVGPDLQERARLTVPWSNDLLAVEGAASPDGRHFAARGPEGRLHVWKLPDRFATALPPLPAPEALAPHVDPLPLGAQLGAPPYAIGEASLFPDLYGELPEGVSTQQLELLGYLEEPAQLLLAMAAFAPRSQQERAEQLSAIGTLSPGWSDDETLYGAKANFLAIHRGGTWYDEDSEEVPGDPARLQRDLDKLVKAMGAKKHVAAYQAWRAAAPGPEGPAFGVSACPDAADAYGAGPAQPPASSVVDPPRSHLASILVRVDTDGTPSWVGTEQGTRNDRGRACFQAHSGTWTPASKDGEAVASCVRIPCWEPIPEDGD